MAKGSIMDSASFAFYLFAVALFIFVVYVFVTNINTEAASVLQHTSVFDTLLTSLRLFDAGFLLLFVGGGIAMIYAASQQNVSPVHLIEGLLLWAFLIIIIAQAGNMYYAVAQSETFSGLTAIFGGINQSMTNIVFLMSILITIILIVLYIRSRETDYQ